MKQAAIILAAGASSRMGSPKALLEFQGETFLDRLIGLLSVGCDPVIVVLGFHAATIRAGVKRQARFVINPDPDRGMLSSLQAALAACPKDIDAVFFTPVDFPAIQATTIEAIGASNASVVIPSYGGRHGHPVRIASSLIEEVLRLPPGAQARDVIRAHRSETEFVEVDDAGILTDIDDPAAYQALLAGAGTHA